MDENYIKNKLTYLENEVSRLKNEVVKQKNINDQILQKFRLLLEAVNEPKEVLGLNRYE